MTQSLDVGPANLGLLTIQCHSEEEDGNFYDGYFDENNVSRPLTPSPNVQEDEFREDSEECLDALALPTPAELEDRLRSIQYKKRSRSRTVTLQNMYEREPEHSDNDLPESDDSDEDASVQHQTQSSGSPEWEPYGKPTLNADPDTAEISDDVAKCL